MISITKKNIKNKFEFFKKVCVAECVLYLKEAIPDLVVFYIVNKDDDNYQLLEESGGAICDIRYSKDTMFSHIYIAEDILEFYKTYYPGEKDRREKFLESLEIPVDEYSLFLIVLLHELGHANLIKLFHDAGIINEYNIFDSLSETTSDLFERRRETMAKWEAYYNNIDLPQLVNGIESQCDIFARDNFLPLWKIINKSLKNYNIGGSK